MTEFIDEDAPLEGWNEYVQFIANTFRLNLIVGLTIVGPFAGYSRLFHAAPAQKTCKAGYGGA